MRLPLLLPPLLAAAPHLAARGGLRLVRASAAVPPSLFGDEADVEAALANLKERVEALEAELPDIDVPALVQKEPDLLENPYAVRRVQKLKRALPDGMPVGKMVRTAPFLLQVKHASLQANLDALHDVLPGAKLAPLLAAAPTLLIREPAALRAKVELLANVLGSERLAVGLVEAQPTVLHLADETLRGKLDGLASLLLLDDGSIPTDRRADELGLVVRRAPRLLTRSIDSVGATLRAIEALLPEADAVALARAAPTLLLSSVDRSIAPKVALLRASLDADELTHLCASGMGRALGCSVAVLGRLDRLGASYPEARAKLAPLTVLLMPRAKFERNFPEQPPPKDSEDDEAAKTTAEKMALPHQRLRGGSEAAPSSAASAPATTAPPEDATGGVATVEAAPASFDQLASRFGVYCRVALRSPEGGGERGLFCTEPVRAGEPLLAVPWHLCLVDEAGPGDATLSSPYEVEGGRAARDTRLAARLLTMRCDADADADVDAEHADSSVEATARRQLWRAWSAHQLPPPGAGAHLPTLDADIVAMLHDRRLAEAARQQQARIDSLLATDGGGGDGGGDVDEHTARLRRWAVAMCSSRPFKMSLPGTGGGGGGGEDGGGGGEAHEGDDADAAPSLCAFIPFIDMANHADAPNCEVQGRAAAAGGAATNGAASAAAAAAAGAAGAYDVVGLVATRDLAAGEEALISYGAGLTNAMLLSNFGFVSPCTNRHDRLHLPLPPSVPPLSGAALRETLRSPRHRSPRWSDDAALLEAALLSLPLSRGAPPAAAAEVAAARQLLAWLEAEAAAEVEAAADGATSLVEDEEALDAATRRLEGAAVEPTAHATGDATAAAAAAQEEQRAYHVVAALRYRAHRKRLWGLAIEVVRAHLASQEEGIGGVKEPG